MNSIKNFKVGTVFNPILIAKEISPKIKEIKISYPSRLNAMALDPSQIKLKEDLKYTAGQISFCVSINTKITVKIIDDSDECIISDNSKRKGIIKHIFKLMKKALNFREGIYINVSRDELAHVGLGLSGAIAGGVASAINELYGKPISKEILLKYIAQNYGEEINGSEEYLSPVQCVGGSVAAGLWEGNILVISGENEVIKTANISSDKYHVLIGIPKNIPQISSDEALKCEVKSMKKFIECGNKYRDIISYNVLHKVLPAMNSGDLKTIGDIIFDYRFNMGSIKNCSFLYPDIIRIADKLSMLKTEGFAEVLSLSSVGPAFFVLTSKPYKCKEVFEKNNLEIYETRLQNEPYQIEVIKK